MRLPRTAVTPDPTKRILTAAAAASQVILKGIDRALQALLPDGPHLQPIPVRTRRQGRTEQR